MERGLEFSKDSFLLLSASMVELLLMSPTENFKRSFKQKDLITNPQGRQRPFEKWFRCLKHNIQVFEEMHSVCLKTLRYWGVALKKPTEFQRKNFLHFPLSVPHYFAICFPPFMKGILKLLLSVEKFLHTGLIHRTSCLYSNSVSFWEKNSDHSGVHIFYNWTKISSAQNVTHKDKQWIHRMPLISFY